MQPAIGLDSTGSRPHWRSPDGRRSGCGSSSSRSRARRPRRSRPTRSQSGRPAQKSSSITHWRKFSCVTGRVVVDAEATAPSAISLRAGGGHDAVHHRVGKAAVARRSSRPAPGSDSRASDDDRLAQDRAVALQVVAALAGERARARASRRRLSAATMAPKAVRGVVGIGGIVADVGMRRVEAAGGRVEVVAAFGHRQRDDADRRIGHRARSAGRCPSSTGTKPIIAPVPRPTCRTGRARSAWSGSPAPAAARASPASAGRTPGAEDRPVLRQPLLHQPVQIPRLVRAVEIAEADMDDAGRQRARGRSAGAATPSRQVEARVASDQAAISSSIGRRRRCRSGRRCTPPRRVARKTAMPVRSSARPMRPKGTACADLLLLLARAPCPRISRRRRRRRPSARRPPRRARWRSR